MGKGSGWDKIGVLVSDCEFLLTNMGFGIGEDGPKYLRQLQSQVIADNVYKNLYEFFVDRAMLEKDPSYLSCVVEGKRKCYQEGEGGLPLDRQGKAFATMVSTALALACIGIVAGLSVSAPMMGLLVVAGTGASLVAGGLIGGLLSVGWQVFKQRVALRTDLKLRRGCGG